MQKYQSAALYSRILQISVIPLLIFLISACNPTKVLQDDEVYLQANKIKIPPTLVDRDQLQPLIKQRDNKRSLWVFKLKMYQYLSFNDSVLAEKNAKKLEKHNRKNEKRMEKGKDTLDFKPVWGFRMKEKGEPPVVFDSSLAELTAYEFEKALFNMGFFQNHVYTEYDYNHDSSKVSVLYHAEMGPRSHLNKIRIQLQDTSILSAVEVANKESILRGGIPFNTYTIEKERLRFATAMRDQGYFYFAKEHLKYEVDSTIGNNEVNIKIIVMNPQSMVVGNDTVNVNRHEKYTIGDILINTSYSSSYPDSIQDSIHFDDLVFINLSRLKYHPHMFPNKIYFKRGDYFSQTMQQNTYTRLSGLNNFKYIGINFKENPNKDHVLDCNIQMAPFVPQSIGFEVEGTNSSGNLGMSGYLTYHHKNIFSNAENLKIRIKGGFEAQRTASSGSENQDNNLINTFEYGIETLLTFQDLVLPYFLQQSILKKYNKPKTGVSFILNNQRRPDFDRFLMSTSFGYAFKRKGRYLNEFLINLVDVSYINIFQQPDFAARLKELNNPLLDATYSDQFIVGSRFSETWTNQFSATQRAYFLNRVQIEPAGNILNAIVSNTAGASQDSLGRYTIGNVAYAQFFKIQNDFRHTQRITQGQYISYRVLGGIGIPYGNSLTLPYDRSFYGGGANDMRGWRARTLGPGSLPNDDDSKENVDQVADIKIQLSIEYRFDLVQSLEGAFFVDAGNIWLLRADESRPNAHFDVERFYKEFAISPGVGARFNFGFLLLRLDWGIKMFDPGLPEGNRFVWAYKNFKPEDNYSRSTFNLGIGYPF